MAETQKLSTELRETAFQKKSVYHLDFHDLDTKISFSKNEKLESLYKFWKSSWEQSFKALECDEKAELFSDDFHAKRALSFFYKGEPIGCIFLETYNLDSGSHRNSKYIENYPADMIKLMRRRGLVKAFALTNLTINPEWRKSQTDLHLSQLLTSIGVWKACQENGDVLLSCTRNNRKVNQVFKNHNAKTYTTERRFNCSVDFIYINLNQANIFPNRDFMNACRFFTGSHAINLEQNI